MSLVNDMLRDLEARGDQPPGHGESEALSPPARGVGRRPLATTLICLLLVGGGVYGLVVKHSSQPAGREAAANSSSDTVADKETAVSPIPAAAAVETAPALVAVAPREDAPEPDATVVQESTQDSAIERLLMEAETALVDDRLTRPPVDNAYALYRHVLLLEPSNARARAGLTQVWKRYGELARNALDDNDRTAARRYVSRAERTGMPEDTVVALRRRIDDSHRPAPTVEPVATAQPTPEPVNTSGSIERSWPSLETQLLERVAVLQQRGDTAAAQEALTAFVARYPQALAATVALFDLCMSSGELGAARALATNAVDAKARAYFSARLLANDGQADRALAKVESAAPDGVLRQPYLSLQAALYQQQGDLARATEIYRQLVALDARQPRYWLGLGIVSEAMGQNRQALQAFTVADRLVPENPAVADYIKERIRFLSQ